MRRNLRARTLYLGLVAGTVVLGLSVYLRGTALPLVARDVLGDALWAVMMLWGVSLVAPAAARRTRAAVALGICVAVELGQLYHAPALDAVRATTLGHLVLGSGFDARDLVAYAAGVLAATALDARIRRDVPPLPSR